MILLVNDAGILIDLLKIDLIEPFFQLENEFHITDLSEQKSMRLMQVIWIPSFKTESLSKRHSASMNWDKSSFWK